MNTQKFVRVSVATLGVIGFAFPLSVLAISLDTLKQDIKATIQPTGSGVNVNGTNGQNVNLQDTGAGSGLIQTNTGGKNNTINLQDTGVGSGTINVNGTTTQFLRDSSGKSITVNTASGLSSQVQVQNLDSASREAIVSLEGNTKLLIKTGNDVEAYNTIVIKERPNVTSVVVDKNEVRVTYHHHAHFLGIIPVSLPAQASVNAQGVVSISLPWYRFLFAGSTSPAEASLRGAMLSQAGAQTSLRAAFGNVTAPSKYQGQVTLVEIMTSVVEQE